MIGMSMIDRDSWSRASRVLSIAAAGGVAGASFVFSSRSTLPDLPGLSTDATAVVGHVALFALLAAAVWTALVAWRVPRRPRLAVAFIATIGYGMVDELHQHFVPGRTASLPDLGVDAVAAGTVLLILWRLEGILRPSGSTDTPETGLPEQPTESRLMGIEPARPGGGGFHRPQQ